MRDPIADGQALIGTPVGQPCEHPGCETQAWTLCCVARDVNLLEESVFLCRDHLDALQAVTYHKDWVVVLVTDQDGRWHPSQWLARWVDPLDG